MKNVEKYERGYYMPPVKCMKWAEKEYVDHAPAWCSVDLRDGNQALIIPMSLEEKLEFFTKLVEIGFKEIEIGFPAASETEYEFCRTLIEKNMIPDDVTIQVLTQSREHIIKKTFEAIDGAKNAVVHLYNSTSVAQREQVFRKDKEQVKQLQTVQSSVTSIRSMQRAISCSSILLRASQAQSLSLQEISATLLSTSGSLHLITRSSSTCL